jgi:ubiquinone/menaquinone biosynthesis C-methylase UbiE
MNEKHLQLCSSAEWAEHIEKTILPWATNGIDLGDHLLEVGPGPGLTTNVLHTKVPRLTAVEIDPMLAANLAERFAGTNVEVVNTDATKLPFPDKSFSAAASFTMLHHVPTVEQQNQILAEIARVLQPGGVLVGTDSLDSPSFRELHIDDICNPVDPLTFEARLRAAGFADVSLQVWSIGVRFFARTAE